jgi:hypothetical protein
MIRIYCLPFHGILYKSKDFSLAISTNLSAEGAVIESQGYDLRAGEILELKIKHPKSDVSVSALGQIAWKKDSWYKCMMGMKFIKIEKEDKNNIIELMTAGKDSTSEPTYQTSDAEEALPQELDDSEAEYTAHMSASEASVESVDDTLDDNDYIVSSEIQSDEAESETEYAAHMSASEASAESVDDTLDNNGDIASGEIQSDEAVLNSGPLKPDTPDSATPVNEISSKTVEKTESDNEEYELELNRAETSRHQDEAESETEYAAHMSASEASAESVDDTLDNNGDIASSEIQSDEAVLNSGPLKSDSPESVAPINEISSQPVEKTESENEEYEIKLNRAETSRHVAVDVSSLKVAREIRDEKERSLKPLISVLTIIVIVLVIIKFEDINRSFKLIGSGSDSSASIPLPKTTASSDYPVSETTNNVPSPPQVKNNSDDDLPKTADKHETTVEESITNPPAVKEFAEKDPPLSANTDEKQSVLPPIKEIPNPSKLLVTAKATKTQQKQNKTEKKSVQLPDKIDTDKKLTAPVRTEKISPQKPLSSLQIKNAAPKTYKPPIRIARKKPSFKAEELLDNTSDRFTAYEELFDNNNNGWDIFDAESSSAIIINGEYRMESKIANGSLINLHYHSFPHNGDFDTESHIKSEMDGKNQAYGIVFGARGILNNYVFKITSEGSYSIGKYVMGTWKEIRGGKIRDGIIKHDSINVLRIVRKNKKVYFFVNNIYVNKYSISSFYGQRIGFIVQGKTVMAVDKTHSLVESKTK